MLLPRLSQSLAINDAWLVGLALALALLVVWAGLVGGAAGLRWLFRTSRIGMLARAGERLVWLARATAVVASPLLVLAAVGILSYGIWQEADFQRWADAITEGWTTRLLWRLAEAAAVLVVLALVALRLDTLRKRHLPRLQDRVARIAVFEGRQEAVARIFGELPEVLSLLLAYLVVVIVGGMLELSGWVDWTVVTLVFVGLVVNGARLLVQVGWLALEVFDGLTLEMVEQTALREYYARVHPLMPLTRRVLEATIYVTGAVIIVHRFEPLEAVAPFGSMSIELIAVFFLARVLVEVVGVLVYKLMLRDFGEADGEPEGSIEHELEREEVRARRVTLAKLIQSLSRFVIYVLMGMLMLVVVGVDPLPLLAGVGVVGFAVGLGAQKILQDIICGFFMLLEDQMLIGDYVKVGDTEGVVEQLHLRVSRIRDRYGRVHTIRNGDVENVINYSRGWTLAVVEMSVAYECELPQVLRVMTSVGEQLHQRFPDKVLGPSEIMGIEAMDDSCLRVRTETKVRPGCHYEIKRVLNRLLFEAFVAHGLEIPYPKGIEFDGVPASPTRPPPPEPAISA